MRFEDERTFFTKPKADYLKGITREISEFYDQTIRDLVDLPEVVKPGMIQESSTPEFLRQQAEYHLRNRWRFPDDIAAEEVADPAERLPLESGLLALDAFSKETTQDVRQLWSGREVPPSFIRIIPLDDPLFTLHLPLYRHNGLNPWYNVFGMTGLLDKEGYANGDYFGKHGGKGTDSFYAYRDEEGNIASYHLKYKGEYKPVTPWSHLLKEDLPVIRLFFERASDYIAKFKTGKTRLVFD
jgi:hypothetical protein